VYAGLNKLQERKLSPSACPSMVPLCRSPDNFCIEHKGAAFHSTHLWLCWGLQMGTHVEGNRAGKCIYLTLGPICCHLSGGNPASDKVGTILQQWGRYDEMLPICCGKAPGCCGRRTPLKGELYSEFKRSRSSGIATSQVILSVKDCFRGRNEGETLEDSSLL